MNRVILAGLAIVLLRDCELAGPRPSPGKVAGTWGGDNAGLIADDTSAHVHIGCTYGNVHQPIVADAHGRFRSEERRVGKECRSRWAQEQHKNTSTTRTSSSRHR